MTKQLLAVNMSLLRSLRVWRWR